MAEETKASVKATQKNDDGRWYYIITIDGTEGPRVGPYDSEDEAVEAGRQKLLEGGVA